MIQHEDVRSALLATSDGVIVELNPNDDFWGGGADSKSENHTGRISMKTRKELIEPIME